MKKWFKLFLTSLAGSSLLTSCAAIQGSDVYWGSHFVFVSARDGDNEIYLSDTQGQSVRQLTFDTTDDSQPRVTIDGRIVFASQRTGVWQIYSMNADGSDQKALTNQPGINNYRPFPSPDGRIVFVSDRYLKPHIFSMNADGTDVQRLTQGDVWNDNPVVTEDGLIYFTSSRGSKWDIWKMGPDGSRPTQLTKITKNVREFAVVASNYKDFDARFTSRSPMIPFFNFSSQSRLVFSAYTEQGNLALYRVNEDGTDLRQLSVKSLFTNRSPVLLSTGQVLFTSDRNGSTDIWTMYPDGYQPRLVIDSPAYDSTN